MQGQYKDTSKICEIGGHKQDLWDREGSERGAGEGCTNLPHKQDLRGAEKGRKDKAGRRSGEGVGAM